MFDEARENDMEAMRDEGMMTPGNNPMKNAMAGMTLEFNDTDGDGFVSRDEFIAHTADWVAMIDRNGDGTISTADFGPKG